MKRLTQRVFKIVLLGLLAMTAGIDYTRGDEIHRALWYGDETRVAELLKADPTLANARNLFGDSPLALAIRHGRDKAFSALLAAGADVNALSPADTDASAPVLHVALYRRRLDMARTLIKAGADVNARGVGGRTALHVEAYMVTACTDECLDYAPELEDRTGYPPNVPSPPPKEAHILDDLLKAGPRVNDIDSFGDTAFDLAWRTHMIAKNQSHWGFDREAECPLPSSPCREGMFGWLESPPPTWLRVPEAVDLLAEHGGETGRPLIAAILANDLERARELLRATPARVKETTYNGFTVLHLVTWADMAELLISSGADLEAYSPAGDGYASRFTPLHTAVAAGRLEVVQALLDHGAKLEARTRVGNAMDVALASQNAAMVRFLEQRGMTLPEARPAHVLRMAAEAGDLGRVKVLLDAGAPINEVDNVGNSALSMALWRGHLEMAQALVDRGADPKLLWQQPLDVGRFDVTHDFVCWSRNVDALRFALHLGAPPDPGFLDEILTVEKAKILLDAGANVNLTGGDGKTALHRAVYCRNEPLVRLLIQAGANVKAQHLSGSCCGDTPLHEAAFFGYTPLALLLIEHGADVNAKNAAGQTPLCLAVQNSHEPMVRLLLEKGASQDLGAVRKTTVLDTINAGMKPAIEKLLLAAGGKRTPKEVRGEQQQPPSAPDDVKQREEWDRITARALVYAKIPRGRMRRMLSPRVKQPAEVREDTIDLADVFAVLTDDGMNMLLDCDYNLAVKLVTHVAKIEQTGRLREPALFTVVRQNMGSPEPIAELIQCMLDAGADINARNRRGQTILDVALAQADRHLGIWEHDKAKGGFYLPPLKALPPLPRFLVSRGGKRAGPAALWWPE